MIVALLAYLTITPILVLGLGFWGGRNGSSQIDTLVTQCVAFFWPVILLGFIVYWICWLPVRGPYALGRYFNRRKGFKK